MVSSIARIPSAVPAMSARLRSCACPHRNRLMCCCASNHQPLQHLSSNAWNFWLMRAACRITRNSRRSMKGLFKCVFQFVHLVFTCMISIGFQNRLCWTKILKERYFKQLAIGEMFSFVSKKNCIAKRWFLNVYSVYKYPVRHKRSPLMHIIITSLPFFSS